MTQPDQTGGNYRVRALRVLAETHPSALDQLIAGVHDERTRRETVDALAKLGPRAAHSCSVMRRHALDDEGSPIAYMQAAIERVAGRTE